MNTNETIQPPAGSTSFPASEMETTCAAGDPACRSERREAAERKARTPFERAAQDEFLRLLALDFPLGEAAKYVGVSRRTIYRHAEVDPVFRARMERNRQDVAVTCRETMKEAARDPDKWRCAVWMMRMQQQAKQERDGWIRYSDAKAGIEEILKIVGNIVDETQRARINHELDQLNLFPAGKRLRR